MPSTFSPLQPLESPDQPSFVCPLLPIERQMEWRLTYKIASKIDIYPIARILENARYLWGYFFKLAWMELSVSFSARLVGEPIWKDLNTAWWQIERWPLTNKSECSRMRPAYFCTIAGCATSTTMSISLRDSGVSSLKGRTFSFSSSVRFHILSTEKGWVELFFDSSFLRNCP